MSNYRLTRAFVICLGAFPLLWPALYNGYPLVYSDSHVFISQPVAGFMNWDKPFVYGPLILLFHGWQSLWGVVVAQGLLISQLVWLAVIALRSSSSAQICAPSHNRALCIRGDATRHLLACSVLALASSAPWFVSFVMPDIFAAMTVLCLFLLTFSTRLTALERLWLVLLGSLAIAVHLSHLVIAAGCLAVVLCLRTGHFKRALLPLLGAVIILLGTNFYAFQQFSISPHGSVFMLARMTGDGNTDEVLEKYCEQKKWYLCEWAGRLPSDSDDFLWNGKGPVWSHPGGPIGLAPEASEIVSHILRTRPLSVLLSAMSNMVHQLWMIQLGDTLHPDHLDLTVAKSVGQYFSPQELDDFKRSRQMKDVLAPDAVWFSRLSVAMVCAGALFSLYILLKVWRTRHTSDNTPHTKVVVGFILLLWMGFFANAFATGALSKPHHRYQARIAWLLVLPPLLLVRATRR